MSVEPIGLATLALGAASLKVGPRFAFLSFVPATLLGSSAAVLLGGSGSIQPAHLLLGFVAIVVLLRQGAWRVPIQGIAFPQAGFWLVALAVYGIVGAFFLPRLFGGATQINAIGSTQYGPSLLLVPLGPTSGNITQSIYLVADVVCFLATLGYASRSDGFAIVAQALLAYSIGNIVFAALDLVTFWTGTAALLDFMRNADYQLHIETAVSGVKRIVGSFTETSSFAYATIGSLGFTLRLWLGGYQPGLTAALSVASLVLLVFSTSTTAYVTLPLMLAYFIGSSMVDALRRPVSLATFAFLLFAPLLIAVVGLAIALTPAWADSVGSFLTILLFDKSNSQSGIERGQWNLTALHNFSDTFGLGGGLGSIRASSFPVALLSNVGVVGTAAFLLFAASILARRGGSEPTWPVPLIGEASRSACIGLLIAATVSGALVDLGLPFFIYAGLASARPGRASKNGIGLGGSASRFHPDVTRSRFSDWSEGAKGDHASGTKGDTPAPVTG